MGGDQGGAGESGTVSGTDCPKGLYGTFCEVHIHYLDILCIPMYNLVIF